MRPVTIDAACERCLRRFEVKRFVQHRGWATNGRCTFCGGYLVATLRGWHRPWKVAR